MRNPRRRVADEYASFTAMAAAQVEGQGFAIRYGLRNPESAVLAIHGGAIERHTDTLALEIAREDLSYYILIGRRRNENRRYLHVASERFEEPRLTAILRRASRVLSIHGVEDRLRPFVMLGGLDLELKATIERNVVEVGIESMPPRHGLGGVDPRNVCNRGSTRRGVQIEISTRLRESLASDDAFRKAFCDAVRSALLGPR